MRIKFTNIGNPLRVDYPVLIVQGIIENFSQDVWKRFGVKSFILMCHQRESDYKRCEEIPLRKLEFKFLVRLLPGSNLISLDFLGVQDTLNVLFDPKPVDYKVRLVYVVCQDSDGKFQGPEGEDCSIESAKARICLGAELLQCITAETLWEAGVGRKTFCLETNTEGEVECHTLRVNLSTTECWEMTGEKLWENIGREIMLSNIRDEKIKYIGFLSSTRYINPGGVQPTSYTQVLNMTKGHVALGGGGLALFGTGALWTWPTQLNQVQARFESTGRIDGRLLMDDSAYRGTVGGCFATTLGSVLHELGHCFDLGHTEEGIMARGFDDLDLFFTLTEPAGRIKPRLNPCSSYQNQEINLNPLSPSSSSAPGDFSPRFTSVRRSDSISKYLEGYTQKRIRSMKNQTASGCFWTSSCSVILSRQKWLNSTPCSNVKVELPELSVVSCCQLAALEIRGEGGIVLNNWTSISPDTDIQVFAAEVKSFSTLVAVTECGNVIKQSINQLSSG